MRVLYAVREDLESRPGGDSVQILNTAAALRASGVEVEIRSCPGSADGFDLVHLWHLERVHETYAHLRAVQSSGRPIVLSPIYWPAEGVSRRVPEHGPFRGRWWREDVKNAVRWIRAGSSVERRGAALALRTGWARCRAEILNGVSILLPNSTAEAQILAGETTHAVPVQVVPNAVSAPECLAVWEQNGPRRKEVLCVGHFDPRKNQLALIEALRGAEIDVTFVGGARRNHRRYLERCRARLGPRMHITGPVPAPDVLRRLAGGRVHACPSYFETPGLANLEAAATGCALALHDCPPVREYFGEQGVYMDASDPKSVRAAVETALNDGPPPDLRRRVLDEFTFEAAARATRVAYDSVLTGVPAAHRPKE